MLAHILTPLLLVGWETQREQDDLLDRRLGADRAIDTNVLWPGFHVTTGRVGLC